MDEDHRLRRLLADTLAAPFQPGAVFDAQAAKPAPGLLKLLADLAVFLAAALAINFTSAAIRFPSAAARYPAGMVALAGALILIFLLVSSFPAAALLHAACRASGGTGPYARSFQLLAALGAIPVLAALLNWVPALWPVPALAGCWLAATGCRRLHGSPPGRTAAVFTALGLLLLAGQWAARAAARRSLEASPRAALAALQSQSLELTRQAQTLRAEITPVPGAPVRSSLELIRGPEPAAGLPPPPERAADAQRLAAGMMQSLKPLLDDPELTRHMSAAEAAEFRELKELVLSMDAERRGGAPMDPKERQKVMQKLQRRLLEIMERDAATPAKEKTR